jgi:hypothetical protein
MHQDQEKEKTVYGEGIPILTKQFEHDYNTLLSYVYIKNFNRNTRNLWVYYLMRHKNWFSFHYDKYFEDLLYLFEFLDVIEDIYGERDNTTIPSPVIINDTFKKALKTFLQIVPLTRLARAIRGLVFDHIIHEEDLGYGIQNYFEDIHFFFRFLDDMQKIYDQKEFLKYRNDRLEEREYERSEPVDEQEPK